MQIAYRTKATASGGRDGQASEHRTQRHLDLLRRGAGKLQDADVARAIVSDAIDRWFAFAWRRSAS